MQSIPSAPRITEQWLASHIKATPQLSPSVRLEQMIAIMEAEVQILSTPNEAPWKKICEHIKCDPVLIQVVSPVLHAVITCASSIFKIQNMKEADRAGLILFNSEIIPFLRKKRCEPLAKAFPTIEHLCALFDTKSPDEIIKILAVNKKDFFNFQKTIIAIISHYPSPEKQYLCLIAERCVALFVPELHPSKILEISIETFACKGEMNAFYASIRHITELRPKKRLPKNITLEQLKAVEKSLDLEEQVMNELHKSRAIVQDGYGKYAKLLHLKYRHCITALDTSKTKRMHFYPICQMEWEKLNPGDFLIKTELEQLNIPENERLRLKNKGKTHFISLKMEGEQNIHANLNLLKTLHSKAAAADRESYESLEAFLLLKNRAYSQTLDNGFENFLKNIHNLPIPHTDQSIFLEQMRTLYAVILEYPLKNIQNQLGHIPPALFCESTFNIVNIAIEHWLLCQEAQKKLKAFVSAKIASQEKKAAPKVPVLKKIKETGKQLFSKKDPILPISPTLATQTLQQQLSRRTANIVTPKVNKITYLPPGKRPDFTKSHRVARWEQTSIEFPDLNYWEENLKQYVYHIPHSLVDWHIHLGIKSIREGSPCISIPAEITFGEEHPIQGTIGYTFGADGFCFHRYFEPKAKEPQKKEAFLHTQFPRLNSAYAEPVKSSFIEKYQCTVIEDAAGNVTFHHTQTATCKKQKINIPVKIKIFNPH